jgi:glycosyltransferase involved in cell wall biosynthesis
VPALRVLHLAPLWFPVARDSPGGIETFLAALLDALEATGCHNVLLASGDSRSAAELLPVLPDNLCARMAAGTALEYTYYEQQQLFLALEHGAAFDVIHSHAGPHAFVLSALPGRRVLHTWHSQVYRDLEWLVERRPDLCLTTVSEFQAARLRRHGARGCHVIGNGLDLGDFPFAAEGKEGLLFIGRMESGKGPDLAVQVARSLDRPLVLAGPLVDANFFRSRVEPYLSPTIRYVGVVDHRQKVELFAGASCALLPFRGEEAFGMVTIEAMACGTPVVALANGALPEIIEPGVTGFLTEDEAELPDLVERASKLDRAVVRGRMAARFDIGVVARRYLRLYTDLATGRW